MIDNTAWKNILITATDFTVVCEIYSADQTPTTAGFDPAAAIGCFTTVSGASFLGITYQSLVKKFGAVNRIISGQQNTATVDFSNISRVISTFEFAHGFEGLIMIIRLISRSQSTTLSLSQILFSGRCEKPTSGSKDSLSVRANWILGGLEVTIPRRKFAKEDQEGRVSTDPEFEGFLFVPQYGNLTFSVRVKRGGIAGFFGFKKTVQKTLSFSSFSDIDANKAIPEVFGRSQLQASHIAYVDTGTEIHLRSAFCEGEIFDLVNVRSLDYHFPLSATSYAELYGKIGAANGPDDPAWVGPGNYSRTAHIRGQANNSAVADVDPAPDVVGVVIGRLMTVPNGSGNWVTTNTWTDNAAAHTRFLLTSPDYFKLDANWIDDADAYKCFLYNNELIVDRSLTDFIFVVQG